MNEIARQINATPMGRPLLQLGAALETLGPPVSNPAANRLASRLANRIEPGARVSEWRTLAFAVGSFEDADEAVSNGAVRQIAARMAVETDALGLRRLAIALFALGESAHRSPRITASESLAARIREESDPGAALDLVQSLSALKDGVPDSFALSAQSALIDHALAARDATTVRLFANGVEELRESADSKQGQVWAAKIFKRLAEESSPEMQLAFGDLLGKLPDGSINSRELTDRGSWLKLYSADCTAALRVGSIERRSSIIDQLRNPLCSEQSWTTLAAALLSPSQEDDQAKAGDASNPGKGSKTATDEDADNSEDRADFHQLILQDDDGLALLSGSFARD